MRGRASSFPRPRRNAFAALAVVVVAAMPFKAAHSSAQGVCGNAAHVSSPSKHKAQKLTGTNKAPLVIGDSTLVLAVGPLVRAGFSANARECRQVDEGLGLLRDLRRRDALPHLTVLALGANGPISGGQIEAALDLIGDKRVLGLLLPRAGPGAAAARRSMRRGEKRHPHRAKVLDWPRFSSGQSAWFAGDGLHVTTAGARGLAHFLKRRLPYARPGRFFR
jgi:hypothetical protein